jgi:hypothetical protein
MFVVPYTSLWPSRQHSCEILRAIIIISLLMSVLLGHRLSLWITYKDNAHTHWARPRGPSVDWWVLTTANAAGTNAIFDHPSDDQPTLLNFHDRMVSALTARPSSSSSFIIIIVIVLQVLQA